MIKYKDKNGEWKCVGGGIVSDMSNYATRIELINGLSQKQGVINDLDDIRSGSERGATAVQPSDLSNVAKSGSYEDLINKPVTPILQQAPTSATTHYTDPSSNKQTAFRLGQACVYPDSESLDGYGISFVKHMTTNAQGTPTSIVWQKLIDERSVGKAAIFEMFGLTAS